MTEVRSTLDRIKTFAIAGRSDPVLYERYAPKAIVLVLYLIKKYGMEAVVNADFALRSSNPFHVCKRDLKTSLGTCGNLLASDPQFLATAGKDTSTAAEGAERNKTAPAAKNEGCVAVEHLQGYVLQHRNHLLRPVLCSRGFCATPNHGIIVNEVYTSMKSLCSAGTWKCIHQTKWMNNLKLAVNRRAPVSENIVVTPYDVRFPRWFIWVVQMVEDAWNLVATSLVVGSVAAAACFLFTIGLTSKNYLVQT